MRRTHCLIAALAIFPVALMSHAAYLESDADERVQPAEPEPPVRILPPPAREVPLQALVRRVEVGSPHTYRGLTVYPLHLAESTRHAGVLTLDEALGRSQLSISEKGSASVPQVRVRNNGHQGVLLMAGELLLGGKQNRIIRDDTLLPPRSEFIDVAVYCGEQDRWSDGPVEFKSGGGLAAPNVRGMAAESATQDRIWREIDGHLRRAEVDAPTRSYQKLYEDRGVRRRLDECVVELRRLYRPRTVGLVAVSHGRIVGADLFSDPSLCSRLWDKICRSYAVDVIAPYRPGIEHDRHLHWGGGQADVRRFLDRVLSARFDRRGTSGAGRLWAISGSVTGSALDQHDAVVHGSLFRGNAVRPSR